MLHDLLDLLVGDEGAVDAGDAAAAGHVEHVALAEELLGAHLAEDGAAVDLRGDLEGDAGREVRLDRAGDDVDRGALRRHDQVDAGGAGHLGEALDAGLDLLAGDHHQVGHLVDDDDDEGHRLRAGTSSVSKTGSPVSSSKPVCTVRVKASPRAERVLHAGVVAVDVAHAHLRHLAVALLHLGDHPLQRDDGLLRVGDDGGEQVRDAVVDGELEHLRVDHDQPALGGRELVEEAAGSWC